MNRPRVAVFSVFSSLDGAYSISTVALDQLRMLERHGYAPQFWLPQGYRLQLENEMASMIEAHPGIECKYILPSLNLKDYGDPTERVGDEFEYQVDKIIAAMEPAVSNVDVVLTHDIMFQTWFVPYAVAVRKLADKYRNVRWLHWIHSAPSGVPAKVCYPHSARYSPMDNAKWIYLNEWHSGALAEMVGAKREDVVVVPNSRDILDIHGAPERINRFIRDSGLLDADAVIVYPTRMCDAKQPEAAVKLAAGIAYSKMRVKLVFASSYSNDDEAKAVIERCRTLADSQGEHFSSRDVLFTSDAPGWSLFCPRDELKLLQLIADVFVLPSISEACSLVALEAAASRTLLVLNDDFPPMREWFGDSAMYLHFGSTVARTEHSGAGMTPEEAEAWYYRTAGIRIADELRHNKVLSSFSKAKRLYNSDAIFRRCIEPLILG